MEIVRPLRLEPEHGPQHPHSKPGRLQEAIQAFVLQGKCDTSARFHVHGAASFTSTATSGSGDIGVQATYWTGPVLGVLLILLCMTAYP